MGYDKRKRDIKKMRKLAAKVLKVSNDAIHRVARPDGVTSGSFVVQLKPGRVSPVEPGREHFIPMNP